MNLWRTAGAALVCAAALLAAATPAQARVLKAIWGPHELPTGNAQCPDTDKRCSAFPVYNELGVDVYQFQIHWDEVAPTRPAQPRNPNDPAYDWSKADEIVAGAERHGVQPAALVQRSPQWASGHRTPIWAPKNPQWFADFLFAAGKRYPSIRMWMIWGEPARGENFQPMRRGHRGGPRRYAVLLDRAYASLKRADPRNVVIGGMTLNGGTVPPPQFIQWLKLPGGKPPRMDLWGHNPFEARFPDLRDKPIGRYRGFNDVDTLFREIKREYRRARMKVPRLWLSEWTIVSDKPISLFSGFFVSRREQARRLRVAYRLSDQAPYVAGLGWFTLMDEPWSLKSASWGLMQYNGVPKPSFRVYRNVTGDTPRRASPNSRTCGILPGDGAYSFVKTRGVSCRAGYGVANRARKRFCAPRSGCRLRRPGPVFKGKVRYAGWTCRVKQGWELNLVDCRKGGKRIFRKSAA